MIPTIYIAIFRRSDAVYVCHISLNFPVSPIANEKAIWKHWRILLLKVKSSCWWWWSLSPEEVLECFKCRCRCNIEAGAEALYEAHDRKTRKSHPLQRQGSVIYSKLILRLCDAKRHWAGGVWSLEHEYFLPRGKVKTTPKMEIPADAGCHKQTERRSRSVLCAAYSCILLLLLFYCHYSDPLPLTPTVRCLIQSRQGGNEMIGQWGAPRAHVVLNSFLFGRRTKDMSLNLSQSLH